MKLATLYMLALDYAILHALAYALIRDSLFIVPMLRVLIDCHRIRASVSITKATCA